MRRVEQAGRKLLQIDWPSERTGTPPGVTINVTLLVIMALGLALSHWRPRGGRAGA